MPVNALRKIALVDIVRSYQPRFEQADLLIDISEEQAVAISNWRAASSSGSRRSTSTRHRRFSRDYSAVMQLTELPFAELKLDRSFVTGCGTDSASAPAARRSISITDFGSLAVGVGIERASDALALVSMGCDYGEHARPADAERFVAADVAPTRQRARRRVRAVASCPRHLALAQARCVRAAPARRGRKLTE